MKERPILFSAPMVRAILGGRKMQTRRVVKHEHIGDIDAFVPDTKTPGQWRIGVAGDFGKLADYGALRCPYGAPGDRMWVKEAHQLIPCGGDQVCCAYRAHCPDDSFTYADLAEGTIESIKVLKWRPSIHMPRWASRITLEVTGVRVERLHAITEDDAKSEGARRFDDIPDPNPYGQGARWSMFDPKSTDECLGSARWAFANAWNHINGPESWDANPWVWVVEFRRVEAQETRQVSNG